MATETSLSRINIFPSESSFNANKGSVGASEISLVKTTNLAVPGYVMSNGVKLLPIAFKSMTKLTTGVFPNGDIPLAQPYTNFDGLYIEVTSDASNGWKGIFVSSWEISRRINGAQSTNSNLWALFSTNHVWECAVNGTTTTLLKGGDDNCIVRNIYGVNI